MRLPFVEFDLFVEFLAARLGRTLAGACRTAYWTAWGCKWCEGAWSCVISTGGHARHWIPFICQSKPSWEKTTIPNKSEKENCRATLATQMCGALIPKRFSPIQHDRVKKKYDRESEIPKKLGIRTASLLVNTYEYVTIKLYSACENACLLTCKTIPFRLSVHSL